MRGEILVCPFHSLLSSPKVGALGGELGIESDIVAAAKWIFYPSANPERWTEAIDPIWILPEDQGKGNCGLGVEDKEYVAWVLSQIHRRRRERLTGPGALLDLCFTAPQYQGKGAGRLLVEWGTRRADEMGVKVGDGLVVWSRCVVSLS
jgi:GNAT superfamily N-acetyltransferase